VAIHVDIIVNNILGVINSQFLKVYSSVRWVKNLGLLVKMWGKASGLIKKSMLSSYAMVLMLIHYLIHKNQVNALMDAREKDKSKPHFHFKRMKAGDTE
jgi:DNA polymerase sigma